MIKFFLKRVTEGQVKIQINFISVLILKLVLVQKTTLSQKVSARKGIEGICAKVVKRVIVE